MKSARQFSPSVLTFVPLTSKILSPAWIQEILYRRECRNATWLKRILLQGKISEREHACAMSALPYLPRVFARGFALGRPRPERALLDRVTLNIYTIYVYITYTRATRFLSPPTPRILAARGARYSHRRDIG